MMSADSTSAKSSQQRYDSEVLTPGHVSGRLRIAPPHHPPQGQGDRQTRQHYRECPAREACLLRYPQLHAEKIVSTPTRPPSPFLMPLL